MQNARAVSDELDYSHYTVFLAPVDRANLRLSQPNQHHHLVPLEPVWV